MSDTELMTILLRAAAEDLPGGAVTPPGPELVARARRRFVRRRGALVVAAAVAALAVAVPVVLVADGGGSKPPQPATPTPYPTTGPGTAAALAHGAWTDLPGSPLDGRQEPAAVWTGTEMLVWGGGHGGPRGWQSFADGAAYDPDQHTWRRLPRSPLTPRSGMASAWTGHELLVWGGGTTDAVPVAFADGAAYDPAKDSWRTIAPSPLAARRGALGMWVDGRFVVLGGQPAIATDQVPALFDGASFDPRTNTWQSLPAMPTTRDETDDDLFATAGDGQVFVLSRWHHTTALPGGATSTSGGVHFATYDVRARSWTRPPAPPQGLGVSEMTWSGRELLVPAAPYYVYGATGPPQQGLRGHRYDPATREWSVLPHGPVDDLRGRSRWTGALLTFNTGTYSSRGSSFVLPGEAAAWDPTSRAWESLPNPGWGATSPAAVWTGAELLVWGSMSTMTGPGPKVGPATEHGLAFGPERPPPAPSPGAVQAPPASRLHSTDDFGLATVHSAKGTVVVDVDRVDMLGGAAAELAAGRHGDQVVGDYYLVNDSPRVRRYAVSPDAVVWGSITLSRTVEPTRSTLAAWYRFLGTDLAKQTLFHFEIDHGVVVGIEEQYRP